MFAAVALTAVGVAAAQADTDTDTTGTWGEANWSWNESAQTLTVEGETDFGEVYELNGNGSQPWKQQESGFVGTEVLEIVFENPEGLEFPENSASLFQGLTNVVALTDIADVKIDGVTNMSAMFSGTKKLENIEGIGAWDVTNVKNMSEMFSGARGLKSLDKIKDWDTKNVTDMNKMFSHTEALESAEGIEDWDTSSVTNMSRLFQSSNLIEHLDLSAWRIGNVTDLSHMFSGATSLQWIEGLEYWNTGKVEDMSHMFFGTTQLVSVGDISGWNTSNLFTTTNMFAGATALVSLDLSEWDVTNIEEMAFMFNGASSLKYLDLSEWVTWGDPDMFGMFFGAGVEVLELGSETALSNVSALWSGVEENNALWYRALLDGSNTVRPNSVLDESFCAGFDLVGDGLTLLGLTQDPDFDGGKFYLRWEVTLSYNLNDGTDPGEYFADQQVLFFAEHGVPLQVPVRSGHVFTGWKLYDDPQLIVRGGSFTIPKSGVTVVAQWRVKTDLTQQRFAGANRYATNVAVNNHFSGEGPVFVATGKDFADALSVASAVKKVGGTLFLTASDSVSVETLAAIKVLEAEDVYIIGGNAAVSEDAEAMVQIVTGIRPQRIEGSDRYKTSTAIYETFFTDEDDQYDAAFVATGLDFPDAISASSAAGTLGGPVVLVDGKNGKTLDSKVMDSLKDHTETVLITGGEKVVNEDIEGALKESFDVTRLSGSDRYGTNLAVNNFLNEQTGLPGVTALWVAAGSNFPDALSAAVPASNVDARLVLSPGTCIPSPVVSEWIKGKDSAVESVNLAGGTRVLSTEVQNLTQCAK